MSSQPIPRCTLFIQGCQQQLSNNNTVHTIPPLSVEGSSLSNARFSSERRRSPSPPPRRHLTSQQEMPSQQIEPHAFSVWRRGGSLWMRNDKFIEYCVYHFAKSVLPLQVDISETTVLGSLIWSAHPFNVVNVFLEPSQYFSTPLSIQQTIANISPDYSAHICGRVCSIEPTRFAPGTISQLSIFKERDLQALTQQQTIQCVEYYHHAISFMVQIGEDIHPRETDIIISFFADFLTYNNIQYDPQSAQVSETIVNFALHPTWCTCIQQLFRAIISLKKTAGIATVMAFGRYFSVEPFSQIIQKSQNTPYQRRR